METKVYNIEGKEVGTTQLPEGVFGLPWSAELVRQVVEAKRANARKIIAHTKGRGEVRGGGKKPWRQKGTGRARHGSIRSPIWVGGGVTHGPTKDKNYSQKINKQMQRKALLVSLSRKAHDNEIIILDSFGIPEAKTRQAARVFNALSGIKEYPSLGKKGGRTLLLLPKHDEETVRATRNLAYVKPEEARNINAADALSYKYIVIPKDSLLVIEKTFLHSKSAK